MEEMQLLPFQRDNKVEIFIKFRFLGSVWKRQSQNQE